MFLEKCWFDSTELFLKRMRFGEFVKRERAPRGALEGTVCLSQLRSETTNPCSVSWGR